MKYVNKYGKVICDKFEKISHGLEADIYRDVSYQCVYKVFRRTMGDDLTAAESEFAALNMMKDKPLLVPQVYELGLMMEDNFSTRECIRMEFVTNGMQLGIHSVPQERAEQLEDALITFYTQMRKHGVVWDRTMPNCLMTPSGFVFLDVKLSTSGEHLMNRDPLGRFYQQVLRPGKKQEPMFPYLNNSFQNLARMEKKTGKTKDNTVQKEPLLFPPLKAQPMSRLTKSGLPKKKDPDYFGW